MEEATVKEMDSEKEEDTDDDRPGSDLESEEDEEDSEELSQTEDEEESENTEPHRGAHRGDPGPRWRCAR